MRKIIRFLVRRVPRPWLIRFSRIFSVLMVPFYKGSRYQCPVCQSGFRKFLPYGNAGADNRLCPSCLSLERHRFLWLYLKNRTDFFTAPRKVLHVAPEQPFISRFRSMKNLDYTTADLVSPLADLKMDIMQIPMPDDIYDVVICNHVLEHVTDDRTAMREILRVLKPGGWAILQVPVDWTRNHTLEDPTVTSAADRERIFGQYDHLRFHGTDYPDRLKEAGFLVDMEDYLASFSPDEKDYFRLPNQEMIWKSTKPARL
ncbi:MAG TPA: methyltransferase domain-containing protein [Bacteroidales bacterium]|nr:methyltransferase domain-containing protein [Bacteroidales bacterium]HRZ49202.1 methyltransferase domain-containing protein [Bacteroidales bacterium]